ncbi:MAG TPA: methyltransferase domain-containing protein [Thermoleophilaceae bacterium]|nr:methyltransferase domain-containing protein [Thermoleophilaceae bacterium]
MRRLVLDDALHLLACPHCAGSLSRSQASVACPNGHSFDVARSGYLSLLPGDAQLGSADTAEMVAAREAFLAGGHYQPLVEALVEAAERAPVPPGCVLDLGAGPGWYLARVLDRLSGRTGVALDLSKHALRRAARAHPRIAAVACDVWRSLPVRDSVGALALSVFAPRNGAETARVLRPGGALLVVTPTERHLAELVDRLGLLTVDERKQERLGATLDAHLDLERRVEREWSMTLTAEDVVNAVAMGPSARHATRRETGTEATPVTASVTISIYRARSG